MPADMEDLENHPLLLDHIIQGDIPDNLLLDRKLITCAKFDEKYTKNARTRLEEDFPEHIIGCRSMEKEKRVITVTSRNTLTIRKSSSLETESKIQCDYFATSICSLITGESFETCQVYFGSVIGDLIDWGPHQEEKPVMRTGHKGMIFSIVTDSTRIFTISDDRTIRMWSITDRNSGPICTVFGHTARPFAICVDSSHKFIYTGGIEQTLFCWKHDESSISLIQKTPLSIGVIRKITQIDKSHLAISSQNGDLLTINVEKKSNELVVLKDSVINFCHMKGKLVILTSKNELILYDSNAMDRIVFRCSNIKHMMSSSDDIVSAWQHNTIIVITEAKVHRLKLSMNIISATCYKTYVAVKTIDGFIQIYDFEEAENVRCIKRFRPQNAAMIPAVIAIVKKDYMIIGTTHGQIFHLNLKSAIEDFEISMYRFQLYHLFGNKEITCIRTIDETSPNFMVLGKTGIWSTFRVTNNGDVVLMNSRNFSAASRMAWPSKFIEWNNQLLIAGFYGTSLVIWNSTTGLPLYETYCGGGHRNWQLNASTNNIYNFDYIGDSELCRQTIDLNSKQHLISTAHSSPIVAAAGSLNYLITVSLDGHMSIADNKGKPILTTFIGENLLCTDIVEIKDRAWIIAGGGKAQVSVLTFNSKELQTQKVFWMRHNSRPQEGRVVAVKTCQLDEKQVVFMVAYSSGLLELFKIDLKAHEPFELLHCLEYEDRFGIGTKIGYFEGTAFVGTSASYLMTYKIVDGERMEETNQLKLSDRSGVTSVAASSDGVYVGCDSGHVYQCVGTETKKLHSHLSTVVGIVLNKKRIHSVSLDCAVLTSASGTSSVLRKPTIIDMPNGMVKSGESIVVVGDGIQLIDI